MEAKFVSPFLMWLVAGIGALFSLLFLPAGNILSSNPLFSLAFAVLLLFWLSFVAAALWKNRQAARSAAGVMKLETSGVYSLVRHPIYFADIIFAWGIFLQLPNLNILLAAVWITLVLHWWMGLEEGALRKKFGKKYRDYCRKVPKFLPKI
jgi:protein-S-isoprenylcysteine O-methyltransferase Ste14